MAFFKKSHHTSDFLFEFVLLAFPIIAFSALLPRFLSPTLKSNDVLSQNAVLGSYSYYQTPQIYISAGENAYSSGGLISLASTDEPAVFINGYKITEDASIEMYRADENAVLAYLTHDDKGKQIKAEPDSSKFTFVTQVKTAVDTGQGTKVTLPLDDSGIWYLRVKVNGVTSHAFVVRSESGTLLKEGNNEFIFWGQYFKNKKSVSDGTITTYNLQDGVKTLSTSSFNADGVAKNPLTDLADIAVVRRNNEIAIIPINLRYLNSYYGSDYKSFKTKPNVTRYFVFTDRPLYRPGDTVYFKAILRDDDDARYSLPQGSVHIAIRDGYSYERNKPIFEKDYAVSADGTIDGQYTIPEKGNTGYYSLTLSRTGESTGSSGYYGGYGNDTNSSEYADSGTQFDVQFFKKPEFFIDVTVPNTHIIAGDEGHATITGQYFSGQPMAGQTISYTIDTTNFYEYDYLEGRKYEESSFDSEYRYYNWYGQTKVAQGSVTLDENGNADVLFDTKIKETNGKHQVYSISATLEDGSQTPSYASRNVLVSAGEYSIYRDDYSWGTTIEKPVAIPLTLVKNISSAKIASVKLSAKIHRTDWTWYQESDKKYPSYKKDEEDLQDVTVFTDANGNATLSFTPHKKGSYTITVTGQDSRGNGIVKTFYSWASEENQPYYSDQSSSSINITADKKEYTPGSTANVTISSEIPDRDVFLTFERGRVDRYEVVHMHGKTTRVETTVGQTDIPNMYVVASSFSNYSLDVKGENLIVSPLEKKLEVQIVPDRKTYGPSDTTNVNISTTDAKGNPVSADVAIWAVDKAIFELSDNKLGNIFNTFWNKRINTTNDAHSLMGILVYNAEMGGGCFVKGTRVLMADGTTKNIEDIKPGEHIATRASDNSHIVSEKVLSTKTTTENSYIILNGTLKVTADHIIRVNDSWREAGSAQVGDYLTDFKGNKSSITSIEWLLGQSDVYNLEIENEHTFIAEGFWVHNQKGDARNTFKDTAYWNPSVHTDSGGRAKISFKLPDNLTTWTFAAVASTSDTKVGQTTAEIIVNKDIVVRPILPNILRVGDEAIVSALVQNFTESDVTLLPQLTFTGGTISNPTDTEVMLKPKETKRVSWTVIPEKENEKGKFTFGALVKGNKNLGDSIEQIIPIRAFGFEERQAETGIGDKTYTLNLHKDNDPTKSSVILSLSSTLLGTLPTAMEYLIQYPYGCIEQTTSRFVPAVIAKANQELFANALKDKKLDAIIDKGMERLTALQKSNGGWSWWYSGEQDPFISTYVIDYVLEAKRLGTPVEDSFIDLTKDYFEYDTNWDKKSHGDIALRQYALTLLNSDKKQKIGNLDQLTSDILAFAVMANYRQGDTNPETNGLSLLQKRATADGDSLFWSEGTREHFGSKDASTALAIRAILFAHGDRNVAARGAQYLTKTRHSDYWSNTFATAQVIQALTDLAHSDSELLPNYNYTVNVDNKKIAGAVVVGKLMKDITISNSNLHNGSTVSINKEGDGQLYSTLVSKEWRTDPTAEAVEHGLKITREYVNEKGYEYSLGLGDRVEVRLTVSGTLSDNQYAVIADELPAGLTPINEAFKNEQYGQPSQYQYGVSNREVTENGMILSLYRIEAGEHTYSYRARVVSEGTFLTPPAIASFMYSPDIYGRTEAQTVQIDKEAKIIPGRVAKKTVEEVKDNKTASGIGIIIIFILAAVVIINKKRPDIFLSAKEKLRNILSRFKKSDPIDQTPPQTPPTDTMGE
jgi:alpha-2-macroglobulin